MTSGLPIVQPSGYSGAGGKSFALPLRAPPLAQARSVFFSSSVSLRSLTNVPAGASACHGGMCPSPTPSRIPFAYGRASSYVKRDIGAISPGRWQGGQFLYRMGATSLANVGTGARAVRPGPAADSDAASAYTKTPKTPAAQPRQTVDWMRLPRIVA